MFPSRNEKRKSVFDFKNHEWRLPVRPHCWSGFPATWWLNERIKKYRRSPFWAKQPKVSTKETKNEKNANDRKWSKKSMMIQKVINYDWDEKWGFLNYDNNWWKLKENNINSEKSNDFLLSTHDSTSHVHTIK